MSALTVIHSKDAPQAIGCYSQAIRSDPFIFLSGQIGMDPTTLQLQEGFSVQLIQVFHNLQAVLKAGGVSFSQVVKLTIYLTDLNHSAQVNETMQQFFVEPYPARAAVQVTALPRGALVEIDGIAIIN